MKDWHTHVFTSTYTADVSGVCSVMYELGGMSVLHDPSGCNSTYTTHDEPRWYDTDSLMYISGLDEMGAILGDDSVLIEDVNKAYNDLHPRFITLCGASIPHIIGFDYKGVAHLIEEKTGCPVLAVPTDGLKSYVSGVGLASREWIKRFALNRESKKNSINLLGVTPIDFADQSIADALKKNYEAMGLHINTCFAMGAAFEALENVYEADVNCIPSSCGRLPARYMYGKKHIPYVEGMPIGQYMHEKIRTCILEAESTGKNQIAYEEYDDGNVLVIGEEIFAKSLATSIRHECGTDAYAMYPDVNEGLDEDTLIEAIRKAEIVIADPLFSNIIDQSLTRLIKIPHIGYSGRIFRKDIPCFTSIDFNVERLLKEGKGL